MKVLEINSVCGIRSTGRICTDLADVLMADGHECRVGYGRETVPQKYQPISIHIGSELNVRWHGLMSRIFGSTGNYSRWATRKFLREVDRYQPDIVHLHNLHGYYLHIGMLFQYLKEKKIPVVWTLHDCWAFTGHCAHFAEVGCDRWQTRCKDCPQAKLYPATWFGDRVGKNHAQKQSLTDGLEDLTIVTPSRWLADLAKQSFLGKHRIEVIHNGIDLGAFRPTEGDFRQKHGLEDKHIVLGVASAWSRSKGLNDFIALADRLPDDFQIVLVGLTAEQIAKMPRKIISIERTNSLQALVELYSAADVFVNPTYADTFPTVNIEALACGTPVLTYRTGGSTEIPDETCGSVVEAGDLEGLCNEILRIARTKPYSRAACTARAAHYNKNDKFREYVRLFEACMR